MFPRYGIDPKDPYIVTRDGKKEVIGKYYVDVIGKDRIAYRVFIDDIDSEYVNDILAILKKMYGDADFAKSDKYEEKIIRWVSEKNPERSVSIIIDSYKRMTISYYCRDIEEKYKEKDQVSIGR